MLGCAVFAGRAFCCKRRITPPQISFPSSFTSVLDKLWKEVKEVTSVTLRSNESQDQLLKRFRKKVAKSGILSTVRRKRWFVSKSELRRINKNKAIRRIKRRTMTDME